MLKKYLLSATIFISMIFVVSCGTNHQVRVKNNSGSTIYNFTVGSVDIGTISNNTTSSYYPIETGSHDIDGNYTSSGYQYDISGMITVLGRGDHDWTISIKSDGSASVSED